MGYEKNNNQREMKFLLKNYKTILFAYILYLITFFWWQLFLISDVGGKPYEIISVSQGLDIGLGQHFSNFLLNALPLIGLIAWKKIFHPND